MPMPSVIREFRKPESVDEFARAVQLFIMDAFQAPCGGGPNPDGSWVWTPDLEIGVVILVLPIECRWADQERLRELEEEIERLQGLLPQSTS